MLVSLSYAFAEEAVSRETDAGNELTVGTLTWFSGNFFSDIFGTNSSDMDVQRLIHGYGLIYWNAKDSIFAFDPTVVTGSAVSDDKDGNRTYTLILNDRLTYSDGSPVTAWDYAFSILLSMDPSVKEAGGDNSKGKWIKGSGPYLAGEVKTLYGVRVFSDYHFSITIDSEYRPFFYELGYLDWRPYPFRAMMPRVEVKDDGNGICFSEPITAELLDQSILNPQTGYMTNPKIVSGPYVLDSYDGNCAAFSINPAYIGNWNGSKPQIEKIYYKQITNGNAVDALSNGEVDLITRCLNMNSVENGMRLTGEDANFSVRTYPRNGFSFLMFCCENEKVSDAGTRQAIAMCMDKGALTAAYAGNYGVTVDGYYGIGQWMLRLVNGNMRLSSENETEQARVDAETAALTLDGIARWDFDIEKAQSQFEAAGWNLNATGRQFVKGKDTLRYRRNGDVLVPLQLKIAIPEATEIGDILTETFGAHLKQAGGELEIVSLPFDQMLRMYHHQETRDLEMIFLGSNFSVVFDPSGEFDPEYAGSSINPTGIADEALYRSAISMSMTEAGDLLSYCKKWISFQEIWSLALPSIPLYSNAYFDFFTARLHNYDITNNLSWSDAIIESYIGDVMTEEDSLLSDENEFAFFN